MIELLNKQLKEYLLEYKKVNDEMKALFEQEQISAEYLKELSKKLAGLKMMIKACVHLAENCKESESMEWEAEIYDIITPKKEKQ